MAWHETELTAAAALGTRRTRNAFTAFFCGWNNLPARGLCAHCLELSKRIETHSDSGELGGVHCKCSTFSLERRKSHYRYLAILGLQSHSQDTKSPRERAETALGDPKRGRAFVESSKMPMPKHAIIAVRPFLSSASAIHCRPLGRRQDMGISTSSPENGTQTASKRAMNIMNVF